MKKYLIISFIALTTLFTAIPKQSNAFVWVVVKEALKKVIKTIDLKIQQLQNKTLALQNAQKAIENAMSKLKLKQIKDWADKEKKLFADYYKELAKVKAAIATYKRVKQIIQEQVAITNEYARTYNLLKNDPHFTPDEIAYMYQVYSGMIDESLKNLNELYLVINSFETKMTDGKRLELIASVADKMEKIRVRMNNFNRQNEQVSLRRSQGLQEVNAVKRYYGLSP